MNAIDGRVGRAAARHDLLDFPPLMPELARRRLQCYLALMLTDMAAIVSGCALAGFLCLGSAELATSVVRAQLMLPVFLTIAL